MKLFLLGHQLLSHLQFWSRNLVFLIIRAESIWKLLFMKNKLIQFQFLQMNFFTTKGTSSVLITLMMCRIMINTKINWCNKSHLFISLKTNKVLRSQRAFSKSSFWKKLMEKMFELEEMLNFAFLSYAQDLVCAELLINVV